MKFIYINKSIKMSKGVINVVPNDLKTKRRLKAIANSLKDKVLFEDKVNAVRESLSRVGSSNSSIKVQLSN